MYYKGAAHPQERITIRLSHGGDQGALRRLAGRDSASVPEGLLLVALVGDELRAAATVDGGEVIADPFRPTAELVGLLTARAEQLRASPQGRDGGLGRLLPREAA